MILKRLERLESERRIEESGLRFDELRSVRVSRFDPARWFRSKLAGDLRPVRNRVGNFLQVRPGCLSLDQTGQVNRCWFDSLFHFPQVP